MAASQRSWLTRPLVSHGPAALELDTADQADRPGLYECRLPGLPSAAAVAVEGDAALVAEVGDEAFKAVALVLDPCADVARC